MDSPIVWVIVAVVVIALLVATWFIAIAYRKNIVETKIGRAESQAREIIDEAQKTAGDTVEQCSHIAEGEGDKQNSYNRDDQCLSGVQQIKGNHHHKVGKTKLDAGNTKIKWDQDFNIAEDHSQSNEKR